MCVFTILVYVLAKSNRNIIVKCCGKARCSQLPQKNSTLKYRTTGSTRLGDGERAQLEGINGKKQRGASNNKVEI